MDNHTIDLDTYRAARREAQSEAPKVKFDGKEYELPVEMPLEVLEALDAFDPEMTGTAMATSVLRVCRILLGEEGYEQFRASRPSLEDVMAFLNGVKGEDEQQHGGVLQAYGFGGPGESSAPVDSSASTGAPAKLHSKRTTA